MDKGLIFIVILLAGLLFAGCAEDTSFGQQPGMPVATATSVLVTSDLQIDSAQCFFFRPLPVGDTLVFSQLIYDIGTQPRRFNFNLPAGKYSMVIFGNIATDRIVAAPPYSTGSIFFSYQGGIEPPIIYYGLGDINVGVDTVRISGMIFLVSQVILTVRDIPAGVDSIGTSVLNTSAGLTFNGYMKETMSPPLGKNVNDITPGGTYTLSTYCFPLAGNEKTTVEIRCYSSSGVLLASGLSQPFTLKSGRRMLLSCSFDGNIPARSTWMNDKESKNFIQWEYDERDW